jgi:hypothetical protein
MTIADAHFNPTRRRDGLNGCGRTALECGAGDKARVGSFGAGKPEVRSRARREAFLEWSKAKKSNPRRPTRRSAQVTSAPGVRLSSRVTSALICRLARDLRYDELRSSRKSYCATPARKGGGFCRFDCSSRFSLPALSLGPRTPNLRPKSTKWVNVRTT